VARQMPAIGGKEQGAAAQRARGHRLAAVAARPIRSKIPCPTCCDLGGDPHLAGAGTGASGGCRLRELLLGNQPPAFARAHDPGWDLPARLLLPPTG